MYVAGGLISIAIEKYDTGVLAAIFVEPFPTATYVTIVFKLFWWSIS